MRTFRALFKSEWVLSLRDMNLPLFGIVSPLLVTIILGMIYGTKPAFDGAAYSFMDQSFGAIAAIGICATGLMGLPLTLADYRHRKILRRFEVTPISPGVLLFVQFGVNLVYALLALVLVFIICTAFFGFHFSGSPALFLLSFLLVSLSIYSLGMLVASLAPNIKTANLICAILYFPMLLFSGATLPYEILPPALKIVADIMPLTQGIKLLKGTALGLPFDNVLVPVVVMVILALTCILISIRFFRWDS